MFTQTPKDARYASLFNSLPTTILYAYSRTREERPWWTKFLTLVCMLGLIVLFSMCQSSKHEEQAPDRVLPKQSEALPPIETVLKPTPNAIIIPDEDSCIALLTDDAETKTSCLEFVNGEDIDEALWAPLRD